MSPVAASQRICQSKSKYACTILCRRNEPSDVAATIASILRQAERMSFRNDGSCHIDDSGISANLRAYPRLQSAFGNQVNPTPSERRQLLDEAFELDQADAYSRLELYHDVDVALGTHLAADRGPEQRKLLNTITAASSASDAPSTCVSPKSSVWFMASTSLCPSKPLNVGPAEHGCSALRQAQPMSSLNYSRPGCQRIALGCHCSKKAILWFERTAF